MRRHRRRNEGKEWSEEFRFISAGFQHALFDCQAPAVPWLCCLHSWLKGEAVVPAVTPAAGPVLPFQQSMRLTLPLISAAFKIPARPMNVAVPARRVTKTWDIGLS